MKRNVYRIKLEALELNYGFTVQELNFINYDIKYRMGRDVSHEGDE